MCRRHAIKTKRDWVKSGNLDKCEFSHLHNFSYLVEDKIDIRQPGAFSGNTNSNLINCQLLVVFLLSHSSYFHTLLILSHFSVPFMQLLKTLSDSASMTQELAVNDLEQPAFDNLPELLQLKQRLQSDSGDAFR